MVKKIKNPKNPATKKTFTNPSKDAILMNIVEFLNTYGTRPYILNLYGGYGFGKTTYLKQALKLSEYEFRVINITEDFDVKPNEIINKINSLPSLKTYDNKLPLYVIKYPQKLTDHKITLLKKVKVPLVLITTEKVYKLNERAYYVSVKSPHYMTKMSVAMKYIQKKGYPKPPSDKLFKIVTTAQNYYELFFLIDNTQPSYDLKPEIINQNIANLNDYQLITLYFKHQIKLPYWKLRDPKFRGMLLTTIMISYRDIETKYEMLKKLAYLDANYKTLDATLQQQIVDNLITKAPATFKIYQPQLQNYNVPFALWDEAKRICPDNPVYALSFFITTNHFPTTDVLTPKEINQIKKFYKLVKSIDQVFGIKTFNDLRL